MKTNIIPFPNSNGLQLSEVEERIRAILAALSYDNGLVEHVAVRMMLFIKNYTCITFEPIFNLPMPPMTVEQKRLFRQSLETGIDGIAGQVQNMVNEIILERLFLEMELYEEKHGANRIIRIAPPKAEIKGKCFRLRGTRCISNESENPAPCRS